MNEAYDTVMISDKRKYSFTIDENLWDIMSERYTDLLEKLNELNGRKVMVGGELPFFISEKNMLVEQKRLVAEVLTVLKGT